MIVDVILAVLTVVALLGITIAGLGMWILLIGRLIQ